MSKAGPTFQQTRPATSTQQADSTFGATLLEAPWCHPRWAREAARSTLREALAGAQSAARGDETIHLIHLRNCLQQAQDALTTLEQLRFEQMAQEVSEWQF